MDRHFCVCWFVLALSWSGSLSATPVEVLGSLPAIEDIALSPDGSQVAFVRTRGETRMLMVAPLGASTPPLSVEVGQNKLRTVAWADDEHVLVLQTATALPMELSGMRREWATLWVLDVPARKFKNALDGVVGGLATNMNVVTSMPQVRRVGDGVVLFAMGYGIPGNSETNAGGRFSSALIRINLKNGASRVQTLGTPATRSWILDGAGSVVAEERYEQGAERWSVLTQHGADGGQRAAGQFAIDLPWIGGIDPDNTGLWVHLIEDDRWVWKQLRFKDGSWGELPIDTRRFDDLLTDRLSGHVLGGSYFDGQPRTAFLEQHHREVWEAVLHALPDRRVRLVSSSDDFNRLVVRIEDGAQGPSYDSVDITKGRVLPLATAYSGLTQVAAVRAISYRAQDGFEIPAYLTLPPDRPATRLPLIVLPHGGPATRDAGDFDWWAQALALQGYAVLQPNFRGSALGRAFVEAGYGQWGRKMQTDLSDGVVALVSQGEVDASRVCIVGASYGGYAALAGITLQSGVYRCAVAVAGISDPQRFLSWIQAKGGNNALADRYFNRFLGISETSDPQLDTISPFKHVDSINVPLLLIHGRDDTVVPFEQSAWLADALKHAGRPVSLIELKGEDHWLSRSVTRLQMLSGTIDFLRKNNPPN